MPAESTSRAPVGIDNIDMVIARDMCVGCGACSVITSGRIPVTIGRFGAHTASTSGASAADLDRASKVCPFSDRSRNEDQIAADHLPMTNAHDDRIGSYDTLFAGRVTSDDYLRDSSSGGMTSWFANRLLDEGMVDAIIHVGRPSSGEAELFQFVVSDNAAEATKHRKSAYHSVSLTNAVEAIREGKRTCAVIGVPCMIRAMRLLCEQDPELASLVKYFLGLVCGHMKSSGFAESMAWQAGVHPDDLAQVDFRVKNPLRNSSEYDFAARSASSDEWVVKPTQSLIGGNWGHGMFQLGACNFCDDVFAETADISFGDAWLPQYRSDWRGTNVIVSRLPELSRLLTQGDSEGEVTLDELDADTVADSQAGNFRHRRIGLSVRLHDDAKQGLPVPRKRVEATIKHIPRKRRRIVRLRRRMSEVSHTSFLRAKESDDLTIFTDAMRPLVREYARVDRRSFLSRFLSRSRKVLGRLRAGI